MTTRASSDLLKSHFDRLKEIIPEVYDSKPTEAEYREEKLFGLMKRSLSIIEAVYFQNRDLFTLARAEEYNKLIEELNDLGFSYLANEELLEKAAAATIMGGKLPMEKAKGNQSIAKKAKKAM